MQNSLQNPTEKSTIATDTEMGSATSARPSSRMSKMSILTALHRHFTVPRAPKPSGTRPGGGRSLRRQPIEQAGMELASALQATSHSRSRATRAGKSFTPPPAPKPSGTRPGGSR